jgi:adenylate cyclase
MSQDRKAARRIFLSYRREEAAGHAGRLFDTLSRRFAEGQVFRDIEALRPGVDFKEVILQTIADCGALIALIGSEWLNATDEAGQQRIDNPGDFVRLEIEAALAKNVPIFPVLVHAAKMPEAGDLPESIRKLATLNATEVDDRHWEYDTSRLITELESVLAGPIGDGALDEARPVQRFATVLQAGLAGLPDLAQDLAPADFQSSIRKLGEELVRQADQLGGTVKKGLGGSLTVIFGAQRSSEDDPQRAVRAALKMVEIVRDRSLSLPSPLALQVGISSGSVLSALEGGSYAGVFGAAVEEAANLRQAAGLGAILVSNSVRTRIRDTFEVELLHIGGEGTHAYRIVKERPETPRQRSKFVGRVEDVSLLDALWSAARRGDGHVISLVGEPGVGKSRLLAEIPLHTDALDVRVRCSPKGAFGPFIELVTGILGHIPRDVEGLRVALSDFSDVQEETVLLLAAFLGLAQPPPVAPPADDQKKQQVYGGVWLFLVSALADRPGFLVLDDLQWADSSSLDLLGFILERMRNVPIMLVLAHRSGFEPLDHVTLKASHTVVRLEPLGKDDSVLLAQSYLGVKSLPADLASLVIERAEGNPFFTEELLEELVELGSITLAHGGVVLGSVDVHIPDTVQAAILARIDRLSDRSREVLEVATILGGRASQSFLAKMFGSEDVSAPLRELERAQLLLAEGEDGLVFRHALIHEVTKASLSLHHRRELHLKVARALESTSDGDPSTLSVLAEHFAEGDEGEKARRYALAAGDLAVEHVGFIEAGALYRRALDLWGNEDEDGRLALLMKLGWASFLSGDMAGAKASLTEVESRARTLGNLRHAGEALSRLGRVYALSGEPQRGSEALDEAIRLLEPLGPTPEIVQALVWSSAQLIITGRIEEGAAVARKGLPLAEELAIDGARSQLLSLLGNCVVGGGDPAGLNQIREGLQLAQQSQDGEALGRAYVNLAICLLLLYSSEECLAICSRGREAMRRIGAPSFETIIAGAEAAMRAELGQYDEASAICSEILDPQQPVVVAPSIFLASLALAQSSTRRGRYAEARELLDRLVPRARRFGGSLFLAPALAAESELEQARGNREDAQSAISEAAEIVMGSGAITHALRILFAAGQALPRNRAEQLLTWGRRFAPRHEGFEAHLLELDALIHQDSRAFASAARLYERLQLPYQEARCLIEAGDIGRAEAIVKRFGLQDGPLGNAFESSDDSGS